MEHYYSTSLQITSAFSILFVFLKYSLFCIYSTIKINSFPLHIHFREGTFESLYTFYFRVSTLSFDFFKAFSLLFTWKKLEVIIFPWKIAAEWNFNINKIKNIWCYALIQKIFLFRIGKRIIIDPKILLLKIQCNWIQQKFKRKR